MTEHPNNLIHKIDKSAVMTIIGILLLFSGAVLIILIAPRYIDPSWIEPTSFYQIQMYEIADPTIYISQASEGGTTLQFVHHLQKDLSLLAFQENESTRIMTLSAELERFITRADDKTLKLTSQLLLLRAPQGEALSKAQDWKKQLQTEWEKAHPDWQQKKLAKLDYEILELYDPGLSEAFSVGNPDIVLSNWVDQNFTILDEPKQIYHHHPGVIYVSNPQEYLLSEFRFGNTKGWRYDPRGEPIKDLAQLQGKDLGFRSRKTLVELGEHIFAIEGCWYCHTDQTRTLVQDVVLNGSDSFPAPPSSANEYIYQKITFPGTRRIGPDLSRVGIKRPSRDWHKSHFWSPKTASRGSIMPAFRHFFDDDPRGTSKEVVGIPNYRFEAIFQYLMTKGTRITPPTQAWWLGRDPVNTIEIIEGQKKLK